MHAVAVVEVAAEAVVLVAAHAAGTRAEGHHGLRIAAEEPVRHVDVVDVLLADVVAGELGEVEPVVAEVVLVRLARLARAHPRHAAVPVHLAAEDRAELALVEGLLHHQVALLVAALRAAHDCELLLLGELRRCDHEAHARTVHGHALLGEHVLAGLDGRHRVNRTEVEGRREDHHVHLGHRHDLLVAVGAAERELLVHAELLRGALRLLEEVVREGDRLHGHVHALVAEDLRRVQEVAERALAVEVVFIELPVAAARAASAAADHGDPDLAPFALRVHALRRSCNRRHRARLDEVSSVHCFSLLVFKFFRTQDKGRQTKAGTANLCPLSYVLCPSSSVFPHASAHCWRRSLTMFWMSAWRSASLGMIGLPLASLPLAGKPHSIDTAPR